MYLPPNTLNFPPEPFRTIGHLLFVCLCNWTLLRNYTLSEPDKTVLGNYCQLIAMPARVTNKQELNFPILAAEATCLHCSIPITLPKKCILVCNKVKDLINIKLVKLPQLKLFQFVHIRLRCTITCHSWQSWFMICFFGHPKEHIYSEIHCCTCSGNMTSMCIRLRSIWLCRHAIETVRRWGAAKPGFTLMMQMQNIMISQTRALSGWLCTTTSDN